MSFLDEKEITARLQAFRANPKQVINQIPQKYAPNDEPIDAPHSAFSTQDIESKHYIEVRDESRRNIQNKEDIGHDRAAYLSNDNPKNLVDNFRHSRLETIESANLTQASLDVQPWSDDYWAIYDGILGRRYADPNYPSSLDWKENFDYIRKHSANDIFLNSGSAARIDRLSPAEKYDALVGDKAGTLSRRMWLEGKRYYDASGKVEDWMGICHGWAPAAYMLERPTGVATAIAPNNYPITFYPSDIKALASLLWANASSSSRFVGGRCNDKSPQEDPDTGRITSSKCFDTNPATWHLSIVNQIGVSQRSFVMDATYDYQVWNQPVQSYQYRYFNPQTMRSVNTLEQAKVAINDFYDDAFKKYRNSRTRYVVGVKMKVNYIVETSPNHNLQDSASKDRINSVYYDYDLEIDRRGKVIGGEWYQNTHPDFLWTPVPDAKARTRYDNLATGIWQSHRPMPKIWQHAARQASSQQSAPLGKVVERLIQLSNR